MISANVDPNKDFRRELKIALKKLEDLTIPFTLMSREWFKANRSIFDEGRKGPGKYADLSPKYKQAKTRAIGSPYPILRGFVKEPGQPAKKSGKLADSMINPTNSDSVNKIINKKALVLGTKVTSEDGAPYPLYLHFGTRKMPARPFVLLGGEQVATREINQRTKNWAMMLQDYVNQVSQGFAS